jgi:hypothetical protein
MHVTERTSFFLEAGTGRNGHARNVSPWRGRCKRRPGLGRQCDHLGVSDMSAKQHRGSGFAGSGISQNLAGLLGLGQPHTPLSRFAAIPGSSSMALIRCTTKRDQWCLRDDFRTLVLASGTAVSVRKRS